MAVGPLHIPKTKGILIFVYQIAIGNPPPHLIWIEIREMDNGAGELVKTKFSENKNRRLFCPIALKFVLTFSFRLRIRFYVCPRASKTDGLSICRSVCLSFYLSVFLSFDLSVTHAEKPRKTVDYITFLDSC